MPNRKATRTSGSQRGASWLLSAAISVVVVVVANLTVFAVAAVFLINTAEAESARPVSMLAAAPAPEVAKLAPSAPVPMIAPIHGVIVAPVRYPTVVPRKKCPMPAPEQKTASLRIARQKNSAGRNAL